MVVDRFISKNNQLTLFTCFTFATTLYNFKVAFSTFWFNPYDVNPSGARHKPRNLT